jgi:hypothetical protein
MDKDKRLVRRVKQRRQVLCKLTTEQAAYSFNLGKGKGANVQKVWLEVKRYMGGEAITWDDVEGIDATAEDDVITLILDDHTPEGRYSIAIYAITNDGARHKINVLLQVSDHFMSKIV